MNTQNKRYDISDETLAVAVESLDKYAVLLDAEAAALTVVHTEEGAQRAAERHAKFLTELFLKHEGLTAEMSVHELQPGEELCPIRLSKDFRAVG